jgi:hypothetical protein
MISHILERVAAQRMHLAAEVDQLKEVSTNEQAEYDAVILWSRKVRFTSPFICNWVLLIGNISSHAFTTKTQERNLALTMSKDEADKRGNFENRLADMKQMMKEAETDVKDTNEMLGNRETLKKRRQDIVAEVKEASNPKTKNLAKKAVANKMKVQRVNQKLKEESDKMNVYEHAFKQILDATGISDMPEVIKKYMEQDELEKVRISLFCCFQLNLKEIFVFN